MALLEVENLTVEFIMDGKSLPAVTDVSFRLGKGEILALVGESGCGKSVSCMALAKLLPSPPAKIVRGRVLLENGNGGKTDVLSLSPKELRAVRGGRIAYIFQEPSVSLNPVFRVGAQIAESVELHRPDVADPEAEALELLRKVGIPDPEDRVRRYPHELSGGMQQRVMIAMALASRPDVLVADEPTTALDVTIQAQILGLLVRLRDEFGMSVILVTHNFGIVAEIADRVAVMYAGRIVETAPVAELMRSPEHPYTRALLSAVPVLGREKSVLSTIPGSVPLPADFAPGCRFSDRCALRAAAGETEKELCRNAVPPSVQIRPGHFAACHLCADGRNKNAPARSNGKGENT